MSGDTGEGEEERGERGGERRGEDGERCVRVRMDEDEEVGWWDEKAEFSEREMEEDGVQKEEEVKQEEDEEEEEVEGIWNVTELVID